jgi:hypothetical protein
MVSDRERALWQAISRGLKLMVTAIDRYVSAAEQTAVGRDDDRDRGRARAI